MTTSGALARLRAGNAQAITAVLAREGVASRADLARGTGLSRATVSSLVAELIEAGRVVETTERGRPHRGGSGRPPLLVRLSAPSGIVAGVDLGHRHVRVALADRTGEVLAEERRALDVDALGVDALEEAATMVRVAIARVEEDPARLRAVGMCLPGPLDRSSARLATGLLPAWVGLDPAAELERRLGAAVHVDNDANLGALAELGHGHARLVADLVYVKLASGVGAGLVLGGRLHVGATGLAGELGHVVAVEDGRACRCGRRGCLETEVSTNRLQDLLRATYGEEVEDLVGLDARGHDDVRRLLRGAGRLVGRVLADLVTSLNPAAVVVGGPLGGSTTVVDSVREAIEERAQTDTVSALEVLPGALGERAEVLGAVSLALAHVAQG